MLCGCPDTKRCYYLTLILQFLRASTSQGATEARRILISGRWIYDAQICALVGLARGVNFTFTSTSNRGVESSALLTIIHLVGGNAGNARWISVIVGVYFGVEAARAARVQRNCSRGTEAPYAKGPSHRR